ncbi:MAG: Gfo/Idh/MocA family oxidoreductase [Blastocatellia bacterium]|nr:Gfo/Idh/MocA family oxidoreductase [Blastocatellia bacterium]MBN8724957.1 Gfo/Idh/MocA family oxidoreductase [Acidobacteriota bacterium]
MIKIALLGTGRVARARIREINLRKDAVIIGVASSNLERAKELATPINAFATIDWQNLVAQADAVMVCSLNKYHAEMCHFALSLSKPVSVDYPLALSLGETLELVNLAAEKKAILHVEHIELLSPWFNTLQKALPEIGNVLSIFWTNLSNRQAIDTDWTFNTSSGFSLFLHAAIISRLIAIAGKARWVNAQEKLLGLESGQFTSRLTTVQIGFENGVIAQLIDGQGLNVIPIANQLVVIGTKGQLLAENHQQVSLQLTDKKEDLPIVKGEGLFSQDIDNFIKQIQLGTKSYVDHNHICQIAQLATAAQRSCQKQQPIEIK